jgi:hypothetical protein
MTRCSFCLHPQRQEFERKIASKELSMSKAAQLMDSNKATVSRHMRNCFPKKVAEWVKPEASKEETLNVVNALIESHDTTLKILKDSLDEGDRRTALMALQTEIKQLELTAKLTGQLNEAPQVNLLMNPEFMKLKQIIVKELAPYPEARVALSDALDALAEDDDNGNE